MARLRPGTGTALLLVLVVVTTTGARRPPAPPSYPAATPAQLPAPPAGFHGMLVLGTHDAIYFLHLAMRSPSPHQFQLVMKARLRAVEGTAIADRTFVGPDAGLDAMNAEEVYFADRTHADNPVAVYTFQPTTSFVLTEIPAGERTSFVGDVVRGHFERDDDPPAILSGVQVEVEEILYFADLREPLAESSPHQQGRLEYLLFGGGDEFFLSHRITLHGTQDESDDNAFHQVFKLSPAAAAALRFGAERHAMEVHFSSDDGTAMGRLPETGGTFGGVLRGLVTGVDDGLPFGPEVEAEHYLEVLF